MNEEFFFQSYKTEHELSDKVTDEVNFLKDRPIQHSDEIL